jgi:hypothetical protein
MQYIKIMIAQTSIIKALAFAESQKYVYLQASKIGCVITLYDGTIWRGSSAG